MSLNGKARSLTILAPHNSIFVHSYIQNVVVPYGFDTINLIMEDTNEYCRYYEENGINLYFFKSENEPELKDKIADIVSRIGRCDFLHVHWGVWSRHIFWPISRTAQNVVVTFYGSDLYRESIFTALKIIPMLQRAKYVQALNHEMRRVLNRRYCHLFDRKIITVDFGCPVYDKIDELEQDATVEDCKERLGIADGSITVSIGYNSCVEQQHIKLIEQLAPMPRDVLDRITVILQFMYGRGGADYEKKVECALNEHNIRYIALKEPMSFDEVAVVRLATDIFLYGQTTDAFSSSLSEHLYAGSVTVKPGWLKYRELEQAKVQYYEYDRFEQIPGILKSLFENGIISEKERSSANRDILKDYNSWRAVLSDWKRLYEV